MLEICFPGFSQVKKIGSDDYARKLNTLKTLSTRSRKRIKTNLINRKRKKAGIPLSDLGIGEIQIMATTTCCNQIQ
ncbi:hypothetical protein LEMLEM_LOCUS904 [Lemmus lemmus]